MDSLNSMNFTVAVVQNKISIEQDMTYIKASLLYADSITLASPVASTFIDFTDKSNRKNEKTMLNLIKKTMFFCEKAGLDPKCYAVLDQFESMILSKGYKTIPMKQKYELLQVLREFRIMLEKVLIGELGEKNCQDLRRLIDLKKVQLYNFKSSLANEENYIYEFFEFLKDSVSNMDTFPLFDDVSNDIIKTAVADGVISLNNINEVEARNAKLASDLLIALPSFEFATIDEILDIRKELEKPLIRFRSKLLSYDKEIQSMPWDEEFKYECKRLYLEEVAPSVLEIDELTKEKSFLKNFGYNFLSDNSGLQETGKLVIAVSLAGILSAYSETMSNGQALLMTGGLYTASKVANAFREYKSMQREITKKDMYFYHRAGKIMKSR